MRWGVRNYQNKDGTLTAAGKARYSKIKSGTQNASNKQAAKNASLIGAGSSAVGNILINGLGAIASPIGLGITATSSLVSAGLSYVATLIDNGFMDSKILVQGDRETALEDIDSK